MITSASVWSNSACLCMLARLKLNFHSYLMFLFNSFPRFILWNRIKHLFKNPPPPVLWWMNSCRRVASVKLQRPLTWGFSSSSSQIWLYRTVCCCWDEKLTGKRGRGARGLTFDLACWVDLSSFHKRNSLKAFQKEPPTTRWIKGNLICCIYLTYQTKYLFLKLLRQRLHQRTL